MGSSTGYMQEYQQAQRAYIQGNYDEAATVIDQLADNYPDDPSVCLLRGHVYCGLQQYDIARDQYQAVLALTNDTEYTNYANDGLAYVNQFTDGGGNSGAGVAESFTEDSFTDDSFGDHGLADNAFSDNAFSDESFSDLDIDSDFVSTIDSQVSPFPSDQASHQSESNWQPDPIDQYADQYSENLDANLGDDFNFSDFNLDSDSGVSSAAPSDSPFADPFAASASSAPPENSPFGSSDSPFTLNQAETELNPFGDAPSADGGASYETDSTFSFDDLGDLDIPPLDDFNTPSAPSARHEFVQRSTEDETLFMGGDFSEASTAETLEDYPSYNNQDYSAQDYGAQDYSNAGYGTQDHGANSLDDRTFVSSNDSFSLDEFDESDFPADESASMGDSASRQSNVDFLSEFDEFDDLGSLPDFDLSDNSVDFTTPSIGATGTVPPSMASTSSTFDFTDSGDQASLGEEEIFAMSSTSDHLPTFTQTDHRNIEPEVSVEQGWLAPLENAPIAKKKWIIAGVTGVVSAITVAAVNFAASSTIPQDRREVVLPHMATAGLAMSVAAGLAGFGVSAGLGGLLTKQVQRTAKDLQAQFDSICQGNFNAKATVYSEDEFGQLATGFNQMSRVILTTTSEAQRKAEEQEQAKEDLQRQVIRLLDDVEGAARGDLTVQAEVTADVLGAVADSFNLTIQNLREIVQQVKGATRQVTKSSTENEIFARSLSSDALRQAEELAVTLNSVQVMTDSIQRVAESAREAEEVARSASATALKGGDAVERTVAGILQIRETVAETTRKVKRLAESSQEISKIVALISQIASRTNLLALNASIEAARAGEAGRGFAIVADEVRQLADRAAKASKEIEQIVLQIQSETGSVMTAMEEGTQQVIEGTRLAEQAKRALEEIIQVSNRIDALVRSITADTIEQTETSRAVAQVMQSVELTAQETSQEAQRVSGSLQHLVGVARDLLASVERFRVEKV